ncbi:MAG: aspartyl/asparaginyl beta-hydroxylase domain-containing protein [Gammaproteobacteria bacterium]|nr:aspartyl/asparaginyl beta-hydroxylase domain-containing protein [Gammaproteobacteria bacterium]
MQASIGDRVKLPLTFDSSALQRDLAILNDTIWVEHFVRQNYQGKWTVLPLRGPAGAEHPVRMIYSDPGCKDYSDTAYLEPCHYFKQVLQSFRCELHAVRLMKLTPGSVIRKHRDYDLSLEDGVVRLHIPIVTSPEVEFMLNDKRVDMHAGECWYLRLSDPHSVLNGGTIDRVHLVIDTPVNEWLTQLLTGNK